MSPTALFIEELEQLGVRLFPEGDRLRCRGPAAVITPELKHRIVEQKVEIIATLSQGYGPGRASPENAARPIEERCAEALELLGELTYLYNGRASAFEFAGLSRAEAERLAMQEVQATKTFRAWMRLG